MPERPLCVVIPISPALIALGGDSHGSAHVVSLAVTAEARD